MFEGELKLDSPITEEQWDMIEDVDFDFTENIWFHTKHGKDIEFVKRRTGHWLNADGEIVPLNEFGSPGCQVCCSECLALLDASDEYAVTGRFCPNCGCKMS